MPGLTRACYGEIVSVGSPECVCVCVRVRERERERESVCVCEREVMTVEREGVQMLEFDGQNSCDHLEPVLHPATKPSPPPPPPPLSWRQPRRAWRNGAFEAPNFDRVLKPETEKRIPANQDVTDCPKLFERSIVAVPINEIKKFGGGDFSKKSGKQFLKKRKVKKKKRNSAEKRKIDIPEKATTTWGKDVTLFLRQTETRQFFFDKKLGHFPLNSGSWEHSHAGAYLVVPCPFHKLWDTYLSGAMDFPQALGHLPCGAMPFQQALGHLPSGAMPFQQALGHLLCGAMPLQQALGHLPSGAMPFQQALGHLLCSAMPLQQALGHLPCSAMPFQQALVHLPCGAMPFEQTLGHLLCGAMPL